MALAIKSYENLVLDDSDAVLNLAWTSDEAECLEPHLSDIIAPAAAAARAHVNEYPVTDPFGEARINESDSVLPKPSEPEFD